jgi:myo-inositol-1(or 4)-monophosphatase
MLEEWLDGAGTSIVQCAEPRAATAAALAVRAGALAMDLFEGATVTWKADESMLTDADTAVQDMLDKEIGAAFPSDGILGEEALLRDGCDGADPYWWVLDPIDGTNNFGRGLPGFCVSIGIVHRGRPVAGAVYDPIARWLYTGAAGEGAWLNGRRLRLAPTPLSSRSLFAIRSPFEDGVPAVVEGWLQRYRLRRFGSTALQLCYVASGALAFVHDHKISLWDVAGAAVVLLEAGGVLTDPEGHDLFPVDPRTYHGARLTCLAGNRCAHADVLRELTS